MEASRLRTLGLSSVLPTTIPDEPQLADNIRLSVHTFLQRVLGARLANDLPSLTTICIENSGDAALEYETKYGDTWDGICCTADIRLEDAEGRRIPSELELPALIPRIFYRDISEETDQTSRKKQSQILKRILNHVAGRIRKRSEAGLSAVSSPYSIPVRLCDRCRRVPPLFRVVSGYQVKVAWQTEWEPDTSRLKQCMERPPRISSLLFVNYRARRIHRAPRYGSTKTTKAVKTKSVLPRDSPNVEPPQLQPKKPLLTTVELKHDKRSLASTYDYLGFHWDPLSGVVSLTEEERSKCLQGVKDGLASIHLPAKSQAHLRSIVATLQHACHVVIPGRSHLQSLIEGVLYKGREDTALLPDDLRRRAKQDLEWWKDLLEKKGDTTNISELKRGKVMDEIYTDASLGGIGIVINGKPSNRRWKEGISPDNNLGEAIAVEVTVRYLATKPRKGTAKGSHFTIKCDSAAVVDSWTLGRCSTNARIDEAYLTILHLLVQHDCWLSLEWVPSDMNQADEPSRSMISLEHPMIV